MAHESSLNYGENMITNATSAEMLRQYEHLFLQEAKARERFAVFCGDERSGTEALYLHLFGGGTFVSYQLTVLRELNQPGSVTEGFDAIAAGQFSTVQETGGLIYGVHSDDHAEHGSALDLHNPELDAIGCGYLKLRASISSLIEARIEDIIAIGKREFPEHFTEEHAQQIARQIGTVHGELARRAGFLPNGRTIAKAVVDRGARTMVVFGDHYKGAKGFMNERADTFLDTAAAVEQHMPAFDNDLWVADQVLDNLHPLFPYDKTQQRLASRIDTIGTLLALGVNPEDIVARS